MVTGQEATQLVLDGKLVANFNKNTSFFFFRNQNNCTHYQKNGVFVYNGFSG